MQSVAKWLIDYVIRKGVVKKEEKEVYQYGFQATLEIILCFFFSAIIASALGMVVEGIFFFIIFIPLRSYAGGLHLNHYWSCLFLSCLTFSVILLFCKFVHVRIEISFVVTLILGLAIKLMYPVENINREIDREEDAYFKKKLEKFLYIDLFIAVVFMIIREDTYLLLAMMTFLMVAITMLIGKCKISIRN